MGKDIPVLFPLFLIWIVAEDSELVFLLVKYGNSVTHLSWKAWRILSGKSK